MNAPQADRVAVIADELRRMGRRLDDLSAELAAVRAAPAPPPAVPVAGPYPPVPPPGRPVPPIPSPAAMAPGYGPVPYPGAFGPPAPYPPPPGPVAPPPGPFVPPPRPVRERVGALSGARLVAWTGAAVTLLGVVLFLALAAARGWFAPPLRVGAGAVLGLALVGLGARLHRREASRTGALAVTGTGIATLYLVVAAATALYDYLPVPVGLLLALLVAAGGLGLADRWRSVLLGTGAVVGAALLAPVVTQRVAPLLVALVLVLQVAATVVALRRAWPVLAGVAAAWPVLYGTVVAALARPADRPATAAVAVAVLVLGVVGAAWAGRAAGAAPAPVLTLGLRIGLVVATPFPVLTLAAAIDGAAGAALAFVAAVLLLGAAALPARDRAFRVVALAAGAVALFEGTAIAVDGATRTAVVLGQAVVLLAVAAALRSRPTLAVGLFFATVGFGWVLGVQVPPAALASHPAEPFFLGTTLQTPALLAAVLVSLLVLAAAAAALVAAGRTRLLGAVWLWVPVGLVGLYGAAGLVIPVALLIAPNRTGFVAGHAVVTVSWTLVALVLLARGLRRPALRVAGLVLVAAAVAKLFLFDLVALDGLARVGAFVGAGLLLLAAGTRYARLVAEAESAPSPPEPAAAPRT